MTSDIRLDKVTPPEAVAHALAEAWECTKRPWLFCSCLAMLRKALNIWSADYRDRHGMKFEKTKGEKDDLYWRLKKISDANPIYRETLGEMMDDLRIDGNDVLHDPVRCPSYADMTLDGSALVAIPRPYIALHQKVLSLMQSAMPDFTMVYGPARGTPTKIG